MIVNNFSKIPLVNELYQPILEFLSDIDIAANTREIKDAIANYFYILEEDRDIRSDTVSNYNILQQRVDNACSKLCRTKLITRLGRGIYSISKLGREVLEHDMYVERGYLDEIENILFDLTHCGDFFDEKEIEKELLLCSGTNELVEITDIDDLMLCDMKASNARLNNMMMVQMIVLSDGTVNELNSTVTRIECSTDAEYVERCSVANRDAPKISIKTTNSSNKTNFHMYMQDGHHRGSYADKWTNPYSNNKKIMDIIDIRKQIKSCGFNESMKILIHDVYKISSEKLGKRIGVTKETIDRIKNGLKGKDYFSDELTLYKIAIYLEIPVLIMQDLLVKSNRSPMPASPPYEIYMDILQMQHGKSIAEINALCKNSNVDELFDAGLE